MTQTSFIPEEYVQEFFHNKGYQVQVDLLFPSSVNDIDAKICLRLGGSFQDKKVKSECNINPPRLKSELLLRMVLQDWHYNIQKELI